MDNEFEPYQINRSALIVTAKQPFVDWLHKVDPTSKDVRLSDINHEPTVYLVPAFEAQDEFMEWLEEYCDTIFAEALDGWDRHTIMASGSGHHVISGIVRMPPALDGF